MIYVSHLLYPNLSSARTLTDAPQIIGAPSFFSTIWGWINGWFDQNTVSKIRIVPPGKELAMLSEVADPADIPEKYGGKFPFDFGMPPELDEEIRKTVDWMKDEKGEDMREMPLGPIKWVQREGEGRTAIAVGKENGIERKTAVMALH